MNLLLFTASLFAIALLHFFSIDKNWLNRNLQRVINSGILVIGFILLLQEFSAVQEHGYVEYAYKWMPELGLNLTIYVDGLSLLFGLIVTGIGAIIFFYSAAYFDDVKELTRFNMFLMTFTGAMFALVMAGNIIVMFIAWELTSITSFLLIGFKGEKSEEARRGASQALVITGGGGLALFAGLLLIAASGDSFSAELTTILKYKLADHPWYAAIACLIMVGAFTKSAQFPFHFWLPGAMSAPTPASAFLHSATMVKAGVYLLARMYPVLGKTDLWEIGLMGVGGTTMIVASILSIKQRDLKGVLAYTTITQLGILVFLLGMPDYIGYKAALVGVIAHALYKAALFLSVGSIDHAFGTRIIDKLGGVAKYTPVNAAVITISALSMAGVPLLFGFVAKEVFIAAAVDHSAATLMTILAFFTGGFMVASSFIIIWDVLFRKPDHELHYHEMRSSNVYGPALLALGTLTFGFLLNPLIIPILEIAVPKEFELKLWPGFHLELYISLSAIAFGGIIFASRNFWLPFYGDLPFSGTQIYRQLLRGIDRIGDQMLVIQDGLIRHYMRNILGMMGIILLSSGIVFDVIRSEQVLSDTILDIQTPVNLMLVILALGAAFASIFIREHLYAVIALGVMGYAVAGLFFIEEAPDVALVQFMVETLSTVLIIIILGRTAPNLNKLAERQLWKGTRFGPTGIYRDVFISIVIGFCITIFAMIAISNRPDRGTIAEWHIQNAEVEAGVPDVVSAILTDFRGIDTFIEIAVVSMAALGILALISITRDEEDDLTPSRKGFHPIETPFIKLAANALLPVAFLISVVHILYGAKAPGDGFTAGVIGGLGVASWFIVFGFYETKNRLPWFKPYRWMIVGLLISISNAFFPILRGDAFLELSTYIDGKFAGIELTTTLIFEIAIGLTVFGALGIIIEALARPSDTEKLGGGVDYDDPQDENNSDETTKEQ